MITIEKTELFTISGGASITGTLINSLTRAITTILELGRSLGTAIRRVSGNNICPI